MNCSTIPLSILATFVAVAGCGRPSCGNFEKNRLPSPDGEWVAVTFSRECGATTARNVQVSLLKVGESLPDQPGQAFVADEGDVRISWSNSSHLQIDYGPNLRIYKKESQSRGVLIDYRQLSP